MMFLIDPRHLREGPGRRRPPYAVVDDVDVRSTPVNQLLGVASRLPPRVLLRDRRATTSTGSWPVVSIS